MAAEGLTHAHQYDERFGQVERVSASNAAGAILTRQVTRDSLGRVKGVHASGAFGARSHAYEYNQANRRVQATAEDGKYWAYGYDRLGQLTVAEQFDATGAPVPGRSFRYGFDDIGNPTGREANGRTAAYQSNALNQIESRENPPFVDVVGEAAQDAEVRVAAQLADRLGDWFHAAVPVDNASGPAWTAIRVEASLAEAGSGGSDALSADEGHAYLPPATEAFPHDADGNLLRDGRWSYEWNGENRLVAMEALPEAYQAGAPRQRLEFAYDGQGRRFRKRVLSWSEASGDFALQRETHWLYDGWNPLFEQTIDGTETVQASITYVWGLDLSGSPQGAGGVGGLLAVTRAEVGSPNATYLPCYDGNGNITAYLSTETGQLAAAFEYGPFGEPLGESGPAAKFLPLRFSTKYTDPETGLLYYGFRHYNPATARWLSRDPIEERGGLNLYGMLGNDPVNRVDVLGLIDCETLLGHLDLVNNVIRRELGKNLDDVSFLERLQDLVVGFDEANRSVSGLTVSSIENAAFLQREVSRFLNDPATKRFIREKFSPQDFIKLNRFNKDLAGKLNSLSNKLKPLGKTLGYASVLLDSKTLFDSLKSGDKLGAVESGSSLGLAGISAVSGPAALFVFTGSLPIQYGKTIAESGISDFNDSIERAREFDSQLLLRKAFLKRLEILSDLEEGCCLD